MKPFFYSLMLLPVLAAAQTPASYLKIAEPLRFNGQDYYLKWSANAMPGYYKEEFLPRGESAERFRNMLVMDWVQADISTEQAVQRKIAELAQLKAAGHHVGWTVGSGGGEQRLDFLMAVKLNGEPVVEHNFYRYRAASVKDKRGVLLFAASRRAYGKTAVERFIDKLPQEGKAFAAKAQAMPFPKVTLLSAD